MGPYLLHKDLNYRPWFWRWLTMESQWVYEDSEFQAHTWGKQDLFRILRLSEGPLDPWPGTLLVSRYFAKTSQGLRRYIIGRYMRS